MKHNFGKLGKIRRPENRFGPRIDNENIDEDKTEFRAFQELELRKNQYLGGVKEARPNFMKKSVEQSITLTMQTSPTFKKMHQSTARWGEAKDSLIVIPENNSSNIE